MGARSFSTIWATVDLPEPDSPTIAVVVPRRIEKETSSTARNGVERHGTFPRIGKDLVRFWTSITASRSPWSAVEEAADSCACSRISARSAAETRRREARDGAAAMSRLV